MGLEVRQAGGGVEATLELQSASPLINPLTRTLISRVRFRLDGERLITLDPLELVGMAPILLASIHDAPGIEAHLGAAFNEYMVQVQRRSSELQALGLSPRVEPNTLRLTSEVKTGDYDFVIAADRRGHFRVVKALKGGQALDTSTGHGLELSEFRERSALLGYLVAMFEDSHGPAHPPGKLTPIRFGELARIFGEGAMVPATSGLEVLLELRVGQTRYRFAAARIAGRSFRGLLAGSGGKLWAERFELDAFPDARKLLAEILKIPFEQVEVVTEERA